MQEILKAHFLLSHRRCTLNKEMGTDEEEESESVNEDDEEKESEDVEDKEEVDAPTYCGESAAAEG